MDKKIKILDPAETVAKKALENFDNNGETENITFLIFQDSPNFRKMVAEHFSDYDFSVEVV